jgi:hypothetical protein
MIDDETKSILRFNETRRLMSLQARDEELLDQALNGREKNIDNVVALWRMVARGFAATMSLPPGRCRDDWSKFWDACRTFLKNEGWTDKQLKDLRYPPPYKGPGIFDDLGPDGD